jgi:hypothetical protein
VGGKSITIEKSAMVISEPGAVILDNAGVCLSSVEGLQNLQPEQVRGKVLIVDPSAGRGARVRAAVLHRLAPALTIVLVSESRRPFPSARPRLREEFAPLTPSVTVWDESLRAALADALPGPLEATVTARIGPSTFEPVKLRNVAGLLRGSDPRLKDSYLLLTAHYDHLGIGTTGEDRIYNGANDDASGTASMIEIARTLASLPARPKRSVIFIALFGEEAGLLGSRYYSRHPIFPLSKTVADLNLEQLGRTDDNSGPRVGVLNATGYDFTDIPPFLAKAGGNFGIHVVKDEVNSDNFYARSDNQAFADAGIPSHTLSVGYIFPEYHQPGDEWPNIDYENMARVARTVALGLYRLADSDEAPHWNSDNPKTAAYRTAR